MDTLDARALPGSVAALVRELADDGHLALLVGGAVRDLVRGQRPADWDVASDAGTAAVTAAAERTGSLRGSWSPGERFGTVGLAFDDGTVVEVTRLRADPGDAEPLVARVAADSAVRDFTINAIAFDPESGALLDPTGGLNDLEAGVLRAPTDPDARFAEDPVRVVRAARFAAELGFTLEPATREAVGRHAERLRDVAVERLRAEMTKLLVAEHPDRGLGLLQESGALRVVLPEVAALVGLVQPSFHDLDAFEHTVQTVLQAPAVPVMRWAALLHDTGKAPTRTVEDDGRIRFFGHARVSADIAQSVCRRLRFSNADTAAIAHLVGEHMRLGDLALDNPRAVDRAVRRLDLWTGGGTGRGTRLVTAEDAVALTVADFASTAHRSETGAVCERLSAAVAASRERSRRHPVLSPLRGDEIMSLLDVPAGPDIGRAVAAIEEAVAAGEVEPGDRDAALRIARTVVHERDTDRLKE